MVFSLNFIPCFCKILWKFFLKPQKSGQQRLITSINDFVAIINIIPGDIAASNTAREKILVLWSANHVFLLETPSVTTGST